MANTVHVNHDQDSYSCGTCFKTSRY